MDNTLDPVLVASKGNCGGNALRSSQSTSALTGTPAFLLKLLRAYPEQRLGLLVEGSKW